MGICVLQSLSSQVVALSILKLIYLSNEPVFLHDLSNQPVFLHDQRVKTKKLNILRTKRAFKMKQKSFFIIFKGLSSKERKQFF